MDLSFSDILIKVFEKHKKDLITITQLKKSLPKDVDQILGLPVKKTNNKEFVCHIIPLLPNGYSIYKKGNRMSLLRGSIQDYILSYVIDKSPVTVKKLSAYLPFRKEEIADTVTALVYTGAINLKIIVQNGDYGIRLDAKKGSAPSDDLKKAYDIVRKEKKYVKIYELRRYLNWSMERFDSCIQSLWDAGVIELQASDPLLLDEDQRRDSYMDKNRTLRILLIWRGE